MEQKYPPPCHSNNKIRNESSKNPPLVYVNASASILRTFLVKAENNGTNAPLAANTSEIDQEVLNPPARVHGISACAYVTTCAPLECLGDFIKIQWHVKYIRYHLGLLALPPPSPPSLLSSPSSSCQCRGFHRRFVAVVVETSPPLLSSPVLPSPWPPQ